MSGQRNLVLAIAGLALAACGPTAASPPIADQWRHVEVAAAPVALGADEVGRLRFRGGLELDSADAEFGGLSGLEALEDGQIIAVTDKGAWFAARLVLDETGALAGLADARLAPMRDEAGEVFAEAVGADAEGLAQLADGRFAVSFEQTQTIRIYDLNRDGPFGAATPGPALGEVETLGLNTGLEALAAWDGALLVGAERRSGNETSLWRAPTEAREAISPFARYALSFGFGLVGADRLPDGDFVMLERFYAPVIGSKARLVRVSAASLEAGEAEKTELALMEPPLGLDNFEGVAAVRAPDGALRLYILSDDNFAPQQRTLLYAFDVIEEGMPD